MHEIIAFVSDCVDILVAELHCNLPELYLSYTMITLLFVYVSSVFYKPLVIFCS